MRTGKPHRAGLIRDYLNRIIRNQIAAFIKRHRKSKPTELLTKVRGGEIRLCVLSNGQKIFLPISNEGWDNKDVRVQGMKGKKNEILFKVFRKQSKATETFLIKKHKNKYIVEIYDQSEGIRKAAQEQARTEYSDPTISQFDNMAKINKLIADWWAGEIEEPPLPCLKKVFSSGKILLCSFKGEPKDFYVGKKYAGEFVFLSWGFDHESKWVIIECEDVRKEFWLVHKGTILTHPFLKSSEEI